MRNFVTHSVLVVLVLMGSLMFQSMSGAEASTLADDLKKASSGFEKLAKAMPDLSAHLGKGAKTKVCQKQLQTLQDTVVNDPLVFVSRDAMVGAFCKVTRTCVQEIVQVIQKLIVGGEKALTDIIEQKLGVPLPPGVDAETLMIFYYDSTCTGKEDNSDVVDSEKPPRKSEL